MEKTIVAIRNEDGEITTGFLVKGSAREGEAVTVETRDENGNPVRVTGDVVDVLEGTEATPNAGARADFLESLEYLHLVPALVSEAAERCWGTAEAPGHQDVRKAKIEMTLLFHGRDMTLECAARRLSILGGLAAAW